MPTEQELVDQLGCYGRWLASRPGLDLAIGGDAMTALGAGRSVVEIEVDEIDEIDEPHRPAASGHARRRHRRLAAAGLALAGIGSTALATTMGADQAAAPASYASPVDPPGALFVLPSDATTAANGSVSQIALQSHAGTVVGTVDGDGYRDPVSVVVTDHRPDPAAGDWRTVELATGPALVDDSAEWYVGARQQRGERWLLVAEDANGSPRVPDVLDQLRLDEHGDVQPRAGSALTVIGRYRSDLTGTGESTYLEVGDGIVVETWPASDALDGPIGLADTIEPMVVGGVLGWRLTRDDSDGAWNAVTWMGAPHRVIGVSGHAPLAMVLAVADDLVGASEATWRAAVDPS